MANNKRLLSIDDLREMVENSPFMNYPDNQFVMFNIPGKPRAKARPRFTQKGHAYTPGNTTEYENWVRDCYFREYGTEREMLKGELVAELVAYFPIAESKSKGTKQLMEEDQIRPKSRPDLDNIAKAVLDALNQIAYKDDSQVVALKVEKKYAHEPRVEVLIHERHLIQ